jgi:predicted RNA binding protein YcfA (HicA-like mRNA interferase family)
VVVSRLSALVTYRIGPQTRRNFGLDVVYLIDLYLRPVDTRKVRRALEQLGCTLVGTKGDHEKWRTPNGLTTTIVAGEKQQSPGLLRSVQRVFEPEFGEGWLEKEVG